jgi:uncharacterized membrane protein YdfJ with MMPL/SSD domain
MTNVVKPNVAINERIKPSTAFNGTKIERNTIINKNTGPLLAFLPVVTIGLLFGLAIDYELFLMTRVHLM